MFRKTKKIIVSTPARSWDRTGRKKKTQKDSDNNKDVRGDIAMSMRGELISKEYQKMVWVRDDKGGEYVCYAKDLESPDHVSDAEKGHCLDTSLVMGPSW